jgi:hypothetical protein
MSKFRSSNVFTAALYLAIVLALAMAHLRQATAYETGGAPLMPVDDAYIHFQYARQVASGEPFVYNPGEDPSSGATSLLYPFILAIGYKLGFTGLNLGYWAYLVGALALFASALTVRAASFAAGLPQWLAIVMGAAVASWGALVWHAFSGMETALVVAFTLLTFHTFERRRLVSFVAAASILAMLRPEASVMAVLASGLYLSREIRLLITAHRSAAAHSAMRNGASDNSASSFLLSTFHFPLILLPVAFAAIQPLLNLALTGTSNAAGSQAKSLLSIVPFGFSYVAGRIFENFARAWEAFLFGIANDGAWMILPPLIGISALFGLFRIARHRPLTALLPLLWLPIIYAAISTLDTAGWHFRRYQMPLLALVFPLTAHAAAALTAYPRSRARLVGYTLILSALLNSIFVGYHAANVESVATQPLAMAHWLAENTPPDALIAVHDVGLIRYVGGRDTLDMVGLTTPGMADAWRNGPGAVGEALIHGPRRPDYIAAYDDARGLSYLADSVYGELLAGFTQEFDPRINVALGGPFQGIYRPSWQGADAATEPRVDAVRAYLDGLTLADSVNVAELSAERAHGYTWRNVSRFDGFASEMYLLDIPGCSVDCRVLDGGRRMNGGESFTLAAHPGRDHVLVSRFHAPDGGTIRVVINDSFSVERTLPAIPGQFVEIPTLIPSSQLTSGILRIRIEPATSGVLIFPYRHWLYVGNFESAPQPEAPVSFQDGAITLSTSISLDSRALTVEMDYWTDGTSVGDWIVFVHIYADLSEPPVVQSDLRPGEGALPPGAWLLGTRSDRIVLDLSDLPPGTYTLAVGFYDAVTFDRLEPALAQTAPPEMTVDSGRVLIDTIEIPGS